MTLSRVKLEAFEADAERAEKVSMDETDLEALQLAAYEKGYSAGWDDSASNKLTEESSLRAEVLKAFQRLTEDHGLLRQEFLNTAESLLNTMMEKVMPEMTKASIEQFIRKNLNDILEGEAIAPCLTVHPDMVESVRSYVPNDAGEVKINGDGAYDFGRVEISFGDGGIAADFGKLFSEFPMSSKASEVHIG